MPIFKNLILYVITTLLLIGSLNSFAASDYPDFPKKVAQLETAMWRSYYSNNKIELFFDLTRLMQLEYRMSTWQTIKTAYAGTRAAFIFKHARKDYQYQQALPYLENFYDNIRQVSGNQFDSKRAAELELQWWLIHRAHRKRYATNLQDTLAELQGVIYQIPPDQLILHAKLRAKAMRLRDEKSRRGKLSDNDWQEIEGLLQQSWQALYDEVNRRKMSVRE